MRNVSRLETTFNHWKNQWRRVRVVSTIMILRMHGKYLFYYYLVFYDSIFSGLILS